MMIRMLLVVMDKFYKIGIVVRFAAMPFVLLSNPVDFHFRWTLSAGMASTLIVPLSCHNKDFRTHAFPAGVATLRSNQLVCIFTLGSISIAPIQL